MDVNTSGERALFGGIVVLDVNSDWMRPQPNQDCRDGLVAESEMLALSEHVPGHDHAILEFVTIDIHMAGLVSSPSRTDGACSA